MNQKKISIIVPIYNVEQYIEQCIASICKQTYTNLEILLIDDGSNDKSLEKCIDAAENDNRIVVIKKMHSGVSATRNTGLRKASGDYIGFVDADDWIEPDMYEQLINSCEYNHSDIAVCLYNKFDLTKGIQKRTIGFQYSIVKGREKMISLFYDNHIQNYLWNKLFSKELFNSLVFDTTITLTEDIDIMYHLFDRANAISFVPVALYNYRINRSGSISNKNTSESLCGKYYVRYRRFVFVLNNYPELVNKETSSFVFDLWYVYKEIVKNKDRKHNKKLIKHMQKTIWENKRTIHQCSLIRKPFKSFLCILILCEEACALMCRVMYMNSGVHRIMKPFFSKE